ncbi:hypothetical protein [Yokenella regensburgei]|uniref:hypothetical protein n=1 Tax=Yokenella regensburgei TaxID=158877 RepID=UPI001432C398|nr:hypothetical protein [Yokenella regensburgei]QIU88260.1 hypothetical protein HEC60_02175 [Yokenella regensburgei]
MKTDLKPIRQQRLKDWFTDKQIPREESSYISQLMTGRTAFGPKAARRLEKDYGMPEGYLDEPFPNSSEEPRATSIRDFDFRQLKLLELADELPDAEVDDIIKLMEEKKRFYDSRFKEYLAKFGIDPAKIELKKT